MITTEQPDVTLAFLISQGFSPTILERFWAKVQKSQEPDGCWLWIGANNGRTGYGKICSKGHNGRAYAHRLSWLIAHPEPINPELEVLHNCPAGDNPRCVNPAHLFLGTHQENSDDCVKKRRVHKGFKLSEEDVLEIIRLRPTVRGKDLAIRFGVSDATISEIVHRSRHTRTISDHEEVLPPVIGDQRKNIQNYQLK